MKQICGQKRYRADQVDRLMLRTKVSRITFVLGLMLMALACCMTDAVPIGQIVGIGTTGAVLTLASMQWTGWGDW